jgi:hypothetical protein
MLVRDPRGGCPHRVIASWRWSTARIIVALLVASLPSLGCRHRGQAQSHLTFAWTLTPSAPAVGPVSLVITLRDAAGAPVKDATVRLEGHMSHAGMTPVFAHATERAPGVYDLLFAFTMQGDWALLVTAALPDGTRLERRIDVANVRADDATQGRR